MKKPSKAKLIKNLEALYGEIRCDEIESSECLTTVIDDVVNYLYDKICELLGVDAGMQAVIIGAGDLGRALVRAPMFEKRGVDIVSMFDVDPDLIGRTVGGVVIRNVGELEQFCDENVVDMAVLTLPKDSAEEVANRLIACGIRGIWNFTSKEIKTDGDVVVENVHLGDSLMILNYQICHPTEDLKKKKK